MHSQDLLRFLNHDARRATAITLQRTILMVTSILTLAKTIILVPLSQTNLLIKEKGRKTIMEKESSEQTLLNKLHLLS